jgi:hypothetical protein
VVSRSEIGYNTWFWHTVLTRFPAQLAMWTDEWGTIGLLNLRLVAYGRHLWPQNKVPILEIAGRSNLYAPSSQRAPLILHSPRSGFSGPQDSTRQSTLKWAYWPGVPLSAKFGTHMRSSFIVSDPRGDDLSSLVSRPGLRCSVHNQEM